MLNRMNPKKKSAAGSTQNGRPVRSLRPDGFTLIELTVVLLILIALAGLALPYLSGTSQASLCRATDVTMQNVKKVIIERFYLDTLGKFPADKGATDYNLKYLFTQGSWQDFDIDSQTGWRGPYLQNGMTLSSAPDASFQDNTKVHDNIIAAQIQVLDAWGRPIVLQDTGSGFRIVSAGPGSGLGLENGALDTTIAGSRGADDRVLYLDVATPSADINSACDS